MPGSVVPDPENYAVVVSETVVDDADFGLNSIFTRVGYWTSRSTIEKT